MSLGEDGQHIFCDGSGCKHTTAVPIALRPKLQSERTLEAAQGWLFVVRQGVCLHFCPNCAPQQLERHTAERLAAPHIAP